MSLLLFGIELIEALLVSLELVELAHGVGEPPMKFGEQSRIAVATPCVIRLALAHTTDVVHLVLVLARATHEVVPRWVGHRPVCPALDLSQFHFSLQVMPSFIRLRSVQ